MITITREQWKAFAPRCPSNYTDALFDNLELLQGAGILDTELRWCHFAGTIYEETGDFRELRESLTYRTTAALKKAWPSRFGRKSDADLKIYLNNPVELGEVVYGIRSGRKPEDLGNTQAGDGYAFRGGGWFQTTGRGNVERYAQKLGMPLPVSQSILDDPLATLKFALQEWTDCDCNKWADANDLTAVAKAINTGSATSNVIPVGLNDRRTAFAKAWKLWGETDAVPDGQVADTHINKKSAAAGIAGATILEVAKNPPDLSWVSTWQSSGEAVASIISFTGQHGLIAVALIAGALLYVLRQKVLS